MAYRSSQGGNLCITLNGWYKQMDRINITDIDFDDDYSYSYHGVLFSGIACEYDEHGKLVAELTMKNGVQEGLSSTFFPAGSKQSEKRYHNNTLHGESREWFENGNLKDRTCMSLAS